MGMDRIWLLAWADMFFVSLDLIRSLRMTEWKYGMDGYMERVGMEVMLSLFRRRASARADDDNEAAGQRVRGSEQKNGREVHTRRALFVGLVLLWSRTGLVMAGKEREAKKQRLGAKQAGV